jgi:hypothetical protein
MATVKDMLATYPADLGDIDREKLTKCIEECIGRTGTCHDQPCRLSSFHTPWTV